jgi:hypothetical protein
VDGKGKIECRGSHRQHLYIPFRSIDIDLFGQEAGLEILEKIDGIVILCVEDFPDLLEPLIKAAFIGSAFLVFPVCGKALFGDLVHPPGPDLYFYPFALGTHDGGVQGFIPVRLGIAQPVTEAFRRRIIFIRYHGIDLPAIFFFFFQRGVEDHPDCKKVIDFFESNAFFAHLVPDRVDALGAAIDIEVEAAFIQLVF